MTDWQPSTETQLRTAKRQIKVLEEAVIKARLAIEAAWPAAGVDVPRTDHIRSVPGGAAFLRVAASEARHTTQCKHYDNNCGAVHPSNCPDCPFRTAGVRVDASGEARKLIEQRRRLGWADDKIVNELRHRGLPTDGVKVEGDGHA